INFNMGVETKGTFEVAFPDDFPSVYHSPIEIELTYRLFGSEELKFHKTVYGNYLATMESGQFVPFILGYSAPEKGYYDKEQSIKFKLLSHPRVEFNVSQIKVGNKELELIPEDSNPLWSYFEVPINFMDYPDTVFDSIDINIKYYDYENRLKTFTASYMFGVLHDENNAFTVDIDVPNRGYFDPDDDQIKMYLLAINKLTNPDEGSGIQHFQIKIDDNDWIDVNPSDLLFSDAAGVHENIISVPFEDYELSYRCKIQFKMDFIIDYNEYTDVRHKYIAILNKDEDLLEIKYIPPFLNYYSGNKSLTFEITGQTDNGINFTKGEIYVEDFDAIKFEPNIGINNIYINFSQYGEIRDAQIRIFVYYYVGEQVKIEEIIIMADLLPNGDFNFWLTVGIYLGCISFIAGGLIYKKLYYGIKSRREVEP
ncbi:MAG: hypothetical protein ACTSRP_26620, partial [Candidatus Helarchaeota archaeon]